MWLSYNQSSSKRQPIHCYTHAFLITHTSQQFHVLFCMLAQKVYSAASLTAMLWPCKHLRCFLSALGAPYMDDDEWLQLLRRALPLTSILWPFPSINALRSIFIRIVWLIRPKHRKEAARGIGWVDRRPLVVTSPRCALYGLSHHRIRLNRIFSCGDFMAGSPGWRTRSRVCNLDQTQQLLLKGRGRAHNGQRALTTTSWRRLHSGDILAGRGLFRRWTSNSGLRALSASVEYCADFASFPSAQGLNCRSKHGDMLLLALLQLASAGQIPVLPIFTPCTFPSPVYDMHEVCCLRWMRQFLSSQLRLAWKRRISRRWLGPLTSQQVLAQKWSSCW